MDSHHSSNARHRTSKAQLLAARGFNIILHRRNTTKSNTMQATLSKEYPNSEFLTIAIDANLEGASLLPKLDAFAESVKNLHLTALINNIAGPPPGLVPPMQLYEVMTLSTYSAPL
jgi:hypothetical protein